MLTENSDKTRAEMENNNEREILKLNYYFNNDNEKKNDGVVAVEESQISRAEEDDSFLNSEMVEQTETDSFMNSEMVEKENTQEINQEMSFINSEPQEISTPKDEKRKRGRPPKKRFLKKEKLEQEYSMTMDTSFETSDIVNQTAPPIVLKFKLGGVKPEPQKDEGMILNQSEPLMIKRGRGRPKKSDSLDTSLEKTADNSHTELINSEVKERLRGRPRKNYLHVQRMWTPKTEREKKSPVKGCRGRPRIHPLPDPNAVSKGRGRPRESYDPNHIKQLLEKKLKKEKPMGFRGRPTKLESLRLALERMQELQTSTKSSDEESNSQLTFPLSRMLDEIQGSKAGSSIENKENLLFVSSKALCDNRKLKERLLERSDPVFREMKLKFKQELKNIQKLEAKPAPNPLIKRRGPRGPYKKTLLKNAGAEEELMTSPSREPMSARLQARKSTIASDYPRENFREPTPTYNTPTIERVCSDTQLQYPSDLDAFMRANNLIFRKNAPALKPKPPKDPFAVASYSQTLIVTKNPFRDQKMKMKAKLNNSLQEPPKKRGRPRKYPLPTPNGNLEIKSTKKVEEACINLISSDDDSTQTQTTNPLNYTYPMVANEPVNYDDDTLNDSEFPGYTDNNVSISLISDDEDDQ